MKKIAERRKVQAAVLKVYRKVSPELKDIHEKEKWNKFVERRTTIFRTMGIPTQLFEGKTLLDVGGGTGEHGVLYAYWGAKVTHLEPNEKSCAYAKDLYAKHGKELRVLETGIFEVDPAEFGKHDIIICEGVCNHVADPAEAIERIVSKMRKGAVIFLGVAETNAYRKRTLQRKLIEAVAGRDEEKIVSAAEKYFHEGIDRGEKHGRRLRESIIYDNYVNPQVLPISLKDTCNVFKRNNIKYLSSYPKMDYVARTDSWSRDIPDAFDYDYYKRYYRFLENLWMTCGEESIESEMKDQVRVRARIRRQRAALDTLEKKLNVGTFADRDARILQKGYQGIGLNQYFGVKE